jgi:hypothetical protein
MGLWAYGHDVGVAQDPPVARGARATESGELAVEFDAFEGAGSRVLLVLSAEELEHLFAGPPVESRYRLPLPHAVLSRSRFRADPPLDLPSGGVAVPVLPWEPDGASEPRNIPPEPSDAPLAIAWTHRYRTGREEYQEALHVQRTSPAGIRRGVFVVEPYSPRGLDLAARVVLLAADVVLIASLF